MRCLVGQNALCTHIYKFCFADNIITTSKWISRLTTLTTRFLNIDINMKCLDKGSALKLLIYV